jgi:hypothetical protein
MPKKTFLDSIKVDDPCSESWEEMTGNDKVRFCSHCAKDVNNISEMTRKDAMRLVRRSNGRICVRYRQDPNTRSPIFAERIAKFARYGAAAGVIGASLLGAGGTYAQGGAELQLVQIERRETTGTASAKISGYVTDPNGAGISYALVTLTNQETMMSHVQNASDVGFYEFKDLDAGKYKLRFEAGGFAVKESSEVYLSESSEARRDSQLALNSIDAVVHVGATSEYEVQGIMVGDISVSVGPSNELVSAVFDNDFENVKARIVMGAKISVRDKSRDGMSPLHAAVETGNLEIAEYLLERGAKVNMRDSEKRTPVMLIDDGEEAPEMLRLLIRFGAKLSLADKEKNTILHHLAENIDLPDVVREAVAHGANVNAVNKEGKTALMIAVDGGYAETVEVLLQSGANVNARDREGKTALDYASVDGGTTRSILELYGAIGGVDRDSR